MSHKPRVRLSPDHIEKLNQAKFDICYVIDYEMTRLQWNQITLASHFGTTQSNISRVVNKK